MMQVDVSGATIFVDTLRLHGRGGFVMLSMFGDHNAVRSAWAKLVSDKRRCVGFAVGDHYVRPEGSYTTIKAPLAEGKTQIVMLRDDASAKSTMFAEGFYQLGDDPEREYFTRLSLACMVPMRPTWAPVLWRLGVANGAIAPASGFGMPIYWIDTRTATWAPLVKGAMLSKEIC